MSQEVISKGGQVTVQGREDDTPHIDLGLSLEVISKGRQVTAMNWRPYMATPTWWTTSSSVTTLMVVTSPSSVLVNP